MQMMLLHLQVEFPIFYVTRKASDSLARGCLVEVRPTFGYPLDLTWNCTSTFSNNWMVSIEHALFIYLFISFPILVQLLGRMQMFSEQMEYLNQLVIDTSQIWLLQPKEFGMLQQVKLLTAEQLSQVLLFSYFFNSIRILLQ